MLTWKEHWNTFTVYMRNTLINRYFCCVREHLLRLREGYEPGRLLMNKALEGDLNLENDYVMLLERIAGYYDAAGEYEVAKRIYRELIQSNPEDGWVRVHFAESLIEHKEYQAAEEVLIQLLEWAPESPYASRKLDTLLLEDGSIEKRLSTWKSLRNKHPEAYVPGLYYGKALEHTDSFQEAIQQYQDLQKDFPYQQEVMLHLGALIARLKDYETGRALMDNAVSRDDDLQELFLMLLSELAVDFQDNGDYGLAERLYRDLTRYKPEDVFSQIGLVRVLVTQCKYDEALECCKNVLHQNCESSPAADLLDTIYEKKEDAAGRIEEWRELCAACPEAIEPWIRLCRALEVNATIEGAYGMYQKLLEHAPENSRMKLHCGILTALLEGYDEGRVLMNEAIAASPGLSGEMAGGLARIAEHVRQQGNLQQAESLYREAIDYTPENYGLYMSLGELSMEQERLDEAAELFMQVLLACPESPRSAAMLDAIYAKQKDNEAAFGGMAENCGEKSRCFCALIPSGDGAGILR